ncbi:MAG: hypothetical protein CVU06_13125 [Bacteroidetes bacterium HGW-Bacteroidetes-22]|nr:MAG: hypothetical protein CVU06_13125 [Bacteroidetes bacterium HGW-Bacteroidetes-22]
MSQWATAILNEIIGRLSERFGDQLIMLFGWLSAISYLPSRLWVSSGNLRSCRISFYTVHQ